MTVILFVHGTGVRGPAYTASLHRIREAVTHRHPAVRVLPCLWGDRLGTPSDTARSVPGYDGRERDGAKVAAEPAVTRWTILDLDPLHDLRLLEALFTNGRRAARTPGREPAAVRLDRLAARLIEPLAYLQKLQAYGLDEAFARALPAVLTSAPARNAATAANEPTQWGDLVEAVAEAVVAETLRMADDGLPPPFTARSRQRLVRALIDDLEGGELGVGGRIAKLSGVLAMRLGGAWALDHWRGPMTDGMQPIVGDILRYLAHGAALREFIAGSVRDADDDVVLVGHSLGGIASLDTVLTQSLPNIRALVTVGSQAPLLHEMGALPGIGPGQDVPGRLVRWVNVYNSRDLLSYVAEPVFGDLVADVEMSDGSVMPQAHSSYLDNDDLYELLNDLIGETGVR